MSSSKKLACGYWYPVPDGWRPLPNLYMVQAKRVGTDSRWRRVARYPQSYCNRLWEFLSNQDLLATDGSRPMDPLFGPPWVADIMDRAAADHSISPLDVIATVKSHTEGVDGV